MATNCSFSPKRPSGNAIAAYYHMMLHHSREVPKTLACHWITLGEDGTEVPFDTLVI